MATEKEAVKAAENKETELKFSKEIILGDQRFIRYIDSVKALLKDGEKYTISEVEKLLKEFNGGK